MAPRTKSRPARVSCHSGANRALHEESRHLAAQRALEILNDPRLSPGHLIGLIQNDNHRQQIQLAREELNHRFDTHRRKEQREHLQRVEHRIRDQLLFPAQMETYRKIFNTLRAVPPHTTS